MTFTEEQIEICQEQIRDAQNDLLEAEAELECAEDSEQIGYARDAIWMADDRIAQEERQIQKWLGRESGYERARETVAGLCRCREDEAAIEADDLRQAFLLAEARAMSEACEAIMRESNRQDELYRRDYRLASIR